MNKRRIVIRDFNNEVIAELDISTIDHANSEISVHLGVETLCDLGGWHISQVVPMVPWGERLRNEPICDLGHPIRPDGTHVRLEDTERHTVGSDDPR